MNRLIVIIGLFLLSQVVIGCTTSTHIDQTEIDAYQVKKSSAGKMVDGFSFRLVSEKEEYKTGEDVKMFAELRYRGEEENITISHADPMISFSIHEVIRDYQIIDIIREIGM